MAIRTISGLAGRRGGRCSGGSPSRRLAASSAALARSTSRDSRPETASEHEKESKRNNRRDEKFATHGNGSFRRAVAGPGEIGEKQVGGGRRTFAHSLSARRLRTCTVVTAGLRNDDERMGERICRN